MSALPSLAAQPRFWGRRSGYMAEIAKAGSIVLEYWQKRFLALIMCSKFLKVTPYAARIWNEYLPFLIGLVSAH